LGVEHFSPDPERLLKFFQSFKDHFLDKKVPIFIVTGTNGKGETTLFIEDLLIQNGFEPFLWSSPHILSARERFSFNGMPIDPHRLINLLVENEELSKELTYYEFLFYLFLLETKERITLAQKPVIIFEVGLGGRLDATNFFDCDYAGLTNISRDHIEILGPTLKDILKEKREIARPGKPLFTAINQGALRENCKKWCHEKKVPHYDLVEHSFWEKLSFKEKNFELAKAMVSKFLDDIGVMSQCLKKTHNLWARPFEVTYGKAQFILVGSHNLDGLRALANWVNDQFPKLEVDYPWAFDEIWLGLSRKDSKEIEQILKLIQSSRCLGKKIRIFSFNHPRATSLELIKKSWNKFDQGKGRPIQFEDDWHLAIKKSTSKKKVLVTGSNYFVSEILLNSPLLQSFPTS
ncbi:MAG: Mur ligase family protein, partial [Halobacteriovoraceae bacterium]|nr:Mur ligase family protein [Halobacteriovoraceae bacterium]